MTHPLEFTREIVNINTLPAAVGISPISQEANSHGFYPDGNLEKDNYSMFARFVWLGFTQQ